MECTQKGEPGIVSGVNGGQNGHDHSDAWSSPVINIAVGETRDRKLEYGDLLWWNNLNGNLLAYENQGHREVLPVIPGLPVTRAF